MLLDTSAWIELFRGTKKGSKVMVILKTEQHFTSIVTIAEIVNFCFRNNMGNLVNHYIQGIKKASQIIDLDERIVTLAGRLNHERKKVVKEWGMMDSFILATSLLYNLKVLTKDSHFRDLENVEMI